MSKAVNPKVLIAMSGGVDSSVSALIVKRKGYQCSGVTMKLFEDTRDLEGAKRAADKLGIEHHVVDFSEKFQSCVIEPFVSSYMS